MGKMLSVTEGNNMCIIGVKYRQFIWCDVHKYGVILGEKVTCPYDTKAQAKKEETDKPQ